MYKKKVNMIERNFNNKTIYDLEWFFTRQLQTLFRVKIFDVDANGVMRPSREEYALASRVYKL